MKGNQSMNQQIRSWSKVTRTDLIKQFDRLDIKHVERSPSPIASRDALAASTAMRQGTINRVSFKFPQHMVFVHKGVGKGVKASQVATSNRRAKEWFNPVMDQDVEKLADLVADNQGDLIVKNLLIR